MNINSIHKGKDKLLTNKEIVSQYFKLLRSKDIDSLQDLFWSDAIVYEPFSKLEQGLRGWSQIEPFLKVAIMANESLSNKIAFEESSRMKNKGDSNNDIVDALVTFQKDDVVKAKFRFELSNHANTVDKSARKKIKALHIQFV